MSKLNIKELEELSSLYVESDDLSFDINLFEKELRMTLEDAEYITSCSRYEEIEGLTPKQVSELWSADVFVVVGNPPVVLTSNDY